jgi:p-hydroxybenzoate 3-monooxygenase
MRTRVGIVGAGPAGLLLSHLLHLEGIDSVVVEAKDRAYVEGRIRAGVLEHQTAELLVETGVGGRMLKEGLVHDGTEIRFGGRGHRIDFRELTGKGVTVYGQHEVVKDLIAARLAAGGTILFDAADVAVHDLETDRPRIAFRRDGRDEVLECDVVAGCDGFHGVCRASIPADRIRLFERVYPFAWLGILAEAPPVSHELIYARHDRGFALTSMRSPTISRHYVQCAPDEDLSAWPDERIWDEIEARLDGDPPARVVRGPLLQKGVTAMRSFVAEPMRYGRLFLAGDSAHIVPPTGAKGMNLAVSDVRLLAQGLASYYRTGSTDGLDTYSEKSLRRIWKVQRFSWWMTSMLHRFDEENEFDRRRQLAELDYVTGSRVAAQSLAENYVGLPFD